MAFLTSNSLAQLIESAVSTQSTRLGRAVHARIVKAHVSPIPSFLSNHLVNMYAKLNRPDPGRTLLNLDPTRSVVTWTSLISGHVANGRHSSALSDLAEMLRERVFPNDFTLPCAFKAAACLGAWLAGRQIHGVAVKLGEISGVFVSCGAFDMYAKTGFWGDACKVFDEMPLRSVCSWNAFLTNAVLAGRPGEAIGKFVEFVRSYGCAELDVIALCAFLNACSDTGSLVLGRQCHGLVFVSGLWMRTGVSNGLVDFYGKCGDAELAERVFHRIGVRNEVSWCSLIAALVQTHRDDKACEIFLQARREGVRPNGFIISSILSACAAISGLELGRSIHALAVKSSDSDSVFVAGALVDMYGKCGSISDAERAFRGSRQRNTIIIANAMIGAYAHAGRAKDAIEVFEETKKELSPSYITFVCLLSACGRTGEVEKGMEIFESMERKYKIVPGPEHYACVVDLLGRSGSVGLAYEFVKKMPIPVTVEVWGALLGACKMYRNAEIGNIAAESLLRLDPKDSGNRVVLSNMLASSGRWEEATLVRKEMKDVGIKKNTGYSWIAVKNTVHVFQAKDGSHERNSEIQSKLLELRKLAEESGHVSDTSFALFDVEEEDRASEVWQHSEKIALAFGLVALPLGAPIRITKNLRICGDCHAAMKLFSGIVGREIVVRDNNRFHHFKKGLCSCSDYW